MEVGEILEEWNKFKEEFQTELDAFNNREGKYNTRELLERASVFKELRGIIPDMHKYLGIGDLIESVINARFTEYIDKFALERGWEKSIEPELESDRNKLAQVSPSPGQRHDVYNDLIPFYYKADADVKNGRTIWIKWAKCPLIVIEKDERNRLTAKFNLDRYVTEEIRGIESKLR